MDILNIYFFQNDTSIPIHVLALFLHEESKSKIIERKNKLDKVVVAVWNQEATKACFSLVYVNVSFWTGSTWTT